VFPDRVGGVAVVITPAAPHGCLVRADVLFGPINRA